MSFVKEKSIETASEDCSINEKITSLKSQLDSDEIKLAVKLYNSIRYAPHDAGVFVSADSQELLNKTYWIVAMETRLNMRPDLKY